MKRVQQGFTLIELMIVVAIVGILAAIALPAYSDYVVRSKMSEGTAALAACKTSVAEYISSHGTVVPADAVTAGCSTAASQYVASLSFDGASAITVATQNTGSKLAGAASDCTLTLTANVTNLPEIGTWTGTSSNCDPKYVPSNFR